MKKALGFLMAAALLIVGCGCQCGCLHSVSANSSDSNAMCQVPTQLQEEYPQVTMDYMLKYDHATSF